jgi:diadenosine tetraphosphate (Ap4A) HIT family hydrolase
MDLADSMLADYACPFCDRAGLDAVLDETEHFFLLADHAPLIEGHLLIVPQAHYACYGAVPKRLESELLALKQRVRRFLGATYREPVFFEHGVFRQTVYHAHLHAMPFGSVAVDLAGLARQAGSRVAAPRDVRDWYAERGHYFYLECPTPEGEPVAAIFPPNMEQYFRVLGTLRAATGTLTAWQPQPMRRMTSGGKVHALAESWRAFSG